MYSRARLTMMQVLPKPVACAMNWRLRPALYAAMDLLIAFCWYSRSALVMATLPLLRLGKSRRWDCLLRLACMTQAPSELERRHPTHAEPDRWLCWRVRACLKSHSLRPSVVSRQSPFLVLLSASALRTSSDDDGSADPCQAALASRELPQDFFVSSCS